MRPPLSPPDIDSLSVNGVKKSPQAEHLRSVEFYTAALRQDPNSVMAYAHRASAFCGLADYGRAIADLNRAIELDPAKAGLYFLRGNAYRGMGDTSRARTEYARAIELEPNEAGFHFYRALHLAESDADAALRDLDRTIELQPGALPAYLERGKLHRDSKRYAAAVADFAIVYEWSGRDAAILPFLEEMRTVFDGLIAADPWNSAHFQERSHIHYVLGDHKAALEDVTRWIALEPRASLPFVRRGLLRHMAGDFIGAAEDADAAIQRDPRSGDAYLHGALALLPLQRISEALSLLTIGITKAPPHPGLRCMRGSIRRQIGRIVDALADINEAIRIQPQNAGAYAERSYIYAARTDWYRAATDAVEAARLAPTPGHLYYAGFTLCQQNRWAEAIPYLDGALKADPNHADARIERERIRHRIRI